MPNGVARVIFKFGNALRIAHLQQLFYGEFILEKFIFLRVDYKVLIQSIRKYYCTYSLRYSPCQLKQNKSKKIKGLLQQS